MENEIKISDGKVVEVIPTEKTISSSVLQKRRVDCLSAIARFQAEIDAIDAKLPVVLDLEDQL